MEDVQQERRRELLRVLSLLAGRRQQKDHCTCENGGLAKFGDSTFTGILA